MAFIATAGGVLASYLLMEGIASLAEHFTGDPEKAVEDALAGVRSQAEFSALQEYTRPTRVQQFMGETFKGVQPHRSLTELAMLRRGLHDNTDPETSPVLSYVTQRLGISPNDFVRRTSPTRIGDMGAIDRALPPQMVENANAQG
jgi:hypothetical protein